MKARFTDLRHVGVLVSNGERGLLGRNKMFPVPKHVFEPRRLVEPGLFIAATAILRELYMVTRNQDDFART
jgi:hypothetical protein